MNKNRNRSIIEAALDEAIAYCEQEGIYDNIEAMEMRAIDWYNEGYICDINTLVALILTGHFFNKEDFKNKEQIKEFYFPEEIDDSNYHIGEIEESLDDIFWSN